MNRNKKNQDFGKKFGQEEEKVIIVKTKNPRACQISGSLGSMDHATGLQDVQNRYSNRLGKCCETDITIDGQKIDYGCEFEVKEGNNIDKRKILIEVETHNSFALPHSLEQFLKSDLMVVSNVKSSCGIARNELGEKTMEILDIPACDGLRHSILSKNIDNFTRKIQSRVFDN